VFLEGTEIRELGELDGGRAVAMAQRDAVHAHVG
jgi:hypothetical protein